MEEGTVVIHPQWGKGTVLFDKPHCIAVRFLEHGQVNFTQEEWAAQKSPPERFRGILSKGGSAESDLEFELQRLVDEGAMTEDEALKLYDKRIHVLELKKKRPYPVSDELLISFKEGHTSEDEFYKAITAYVTKVVKKESHNSRSTFSNIEDAIQDSVMEVWQKLDTFDPKRGSFARWVHTITVRNGIDLMRKYRTDRGSDQNFQDEPVRTVLLEDEDIASGEMDAEKRFQLKEYMNRLKPADRTVVQLVLDGLTHEEIAEALGVDRTAITKRLNRLGKKNVTKLSF